MLYMIVVLTFHCLFFVTGMVGNIFILVMNFLDWMETQIVSPCTLTISSLGLSNVFLQVTMLANELCALLLQKYYAQDSVVNLFLAFLISLFFSSLFLSICLCFYYFVKIIQSPQPFFQLLKTKIRAIIPWLLGLSILVSFSLGMPAYWDIYRKPLGSTNQSENGTLAFNMQFESKCQCIFNIYMLLSSLVFMVYFILALAIIRSLNKHMRKVKKNSDGFNANLGAHVAAAKTLTSLLFLNICFFAALSILFNISKTATAWYFPVCLIIVSCFPTMNSLILIIGNSKLRNYVKRLLFTKNCMDTNKPQ